MHNNFLFVVCLLLSMLLLESVAVVCVIIVTTGRLETYTSVLRTHIQVCYAHIHSAAFSISWLSLSPAIFLIHCIPYRNDHILRLSALLCVKRVCQHELMATLFHFCLAIRHFHSVQTFVLHSNIFIAFFLLRSTMIHSHCIPIHLIHLQSNFSFRYLFCTLLSHNNFNSTSLKQVGDIYNEKKMYEILSLIFSSFRFREGP